MRTTRGERPQAPPSLLSEAVLVHPDQVLEHPSMRAEDKRALLSSWASDRHAVENAPGLRRLDSGAVVAVDDILAALAALDQGRPGDGPTAMDHTPTPPSAADPRRLRRCTRSRAPRQVPPPEPLTRPKTDRL